MTASGQTRPSDTPPAAAACPLRPESGHVKTFKVSIDGGTVFVDAETLNDLRRFNVPPLIRLIAHSNLLVKEIGIPKLTARCARPRSQSS